MVVLVPAAEESEIPEEPVVVIVLFVTAMPVLVEDTEMPPEVFWLITALKPLKTEILLFAERVLFAIDAATGVAVRPETEMP